MYLNGIVSGAKNTFNTVKSGIESYLIKPAKAVGKYARDNPVSTAIYSVGGGVLISGLSKISAGDEGQLFFLGATIFSAATIYAGASYHFWKENPSIFSQYRALEEKMEKGKTIKPKQLARLKAKIQEVYQGDAVSDNIGDISTGILNLIDAESSKTHFSIIDEEDYGGWESLRRAAVETGKIEELYSAVKNFRQKVGPENLISPLEALLIEDPEFKEIVLGRA